MLSDNPFAPTFGASPPVLAGRSHIIDDIVSSWDTGPTHPNYTVLLLGRRGSGKTVVLKELRARAQKRGWLTISSAAVTAGLLNRIGHAALIHLNRLTASLEDDLSADLAAAGIQIGAAYDPVADVSRRIGEILSVLANHLARKNSGLFVTVDEMHAGDTNDLRMFAVTLQDVTRIAQLPLAFVGAGLPVLEETLLTDRSVTFLQRCPRYEVDFLDSVGTQVAIAEPIRQRGGRCQPKALEYAADAALGYPIMVQLVGFHSWQVAESPHQEITMKDFVTGTQVAFRQFGQLVIAPLWRDQSPAARRFLVAMAQDKNESLLKEIARRLGVTSGYVSVYRARLVRSGLVTNVSKHVLSFALPSTRRWIEDLEEYAHIAESLNFETNAPLGFAVPGSRRDD